MNGKLAPQMMRVSYYAFFRQIYAPRLMAIDVMLKTMERPLTASEAAETLGMPEDEIYRLMELSSVSLLDKNGFLAVMSLGGGVGGMLRRELSRGMKQVYSPSDIAYIYGLHVKTVRAAFRRLGYKKMPAHLVPTLLNQIPVFIYF